MVCLATDGTSKISWPGYGCFKPKKVQVPGFEVQEGNWQVLLLSPDSILQQKACQELWLHPEEHLCITETENLADFSGETRSGRNVQCLPAWRLPLSPVGHAGPCPSVTWATIFQRSSTTVFVVGEGCCKSRQLLFSKKGVHADQWKMGAVIRILLGHHHLQDKQRGEG